MARGKVGKLPPPVSNKHALSSAQILVLFLYLNSDLYLQDRVHFGVRRNNKYKLCAESQPELICIFWGAGVVVGNSSFAQSYKVKNYNGK